MAPWFARHLKDKADKDGPAVPGGAGLPHRGERLADLRPLAAPGGARARSTPAPAAGWRSSRRRPPRTATPDSTPTSPTPPTRSRSAPGRSAPTSSSARTARSPAIPSGASGWCRTSGSCTCAPTCSATRPTPLERDLDLAGPIAARLFASTSGTDCDWVVKLIDVFPEGDPAMGGYQLIIADEVFRARLNWCQFNFLLPAPAPAAWGVSLDQDKMN